MEPKCLDRLDFGSITKKTHALDLPFVRLQGSNYKQKRPFGILTSPLHSDHKNDQRNRRQISVDSNVHSTRGFPSVKFWIYLNILFLTKFKIPSHSHFWWTLDFGPPYFEAKKTGSAGDSRQLESPLIHPTKHPKQATKNCEVLMRKCSTLDWGDPWLLTSFWSFPRTGLPPVIILVDRILHEISHPALGLSTVSGNLHVMCNSEKPRIHTNYPLGI